MKIGLDATGGFAQVRLGRLKRSSARKESGILMTGSELGAQTWGSVSVGAEAAFDFQLALRADMGPGGVLYRRNDSTARSSLSSASPKGAENLT